MRYRSYVKPAIKTLTTGEILESLGPVSCGSGIPPTGPGSAIDPFGVGNNSDGYKGMN